MFALPGARRRYMAVAFFFCALCGVFAKAEVCQSDKKQLQRPGRHLLQVDAQGGQKLLRKAEAEIQSESESQLDARKIMRKRLKHAKCSKALALQAPLNDTGYQNVSSTCCYQDMKEYIRRVAAKNSIKICGEGGLSGFAPYYSCPIKPRLLRDLETEMTQAKQIYGNKCSWLTDNYLDCNKIDPSCTPLPVCEDGIFCGYLALQVTMNPSAMITNPGVRLGILDAMATFFFEEHQQQGDDDDDDGSLLQRKTREAKRRLERAQYLTVKLGSAPDSFSMSLLQSSNGKSDKRICTVFASFSVLTNPWIGPWEADSQFDELLSADDDTHRKELADGIVDDIENTHDSTIRSQIGRVEITSIRACPRDAHSGVDPVRLCRNHTTSDPVSSS